MVHFCKVVVLFDHTSTRNFAAPPGGSFRRTRRPRIVGNLKSEPECKTPPSSSQTSRSPRSYEAMTEPQTVWSGKLQSE